MPVLVKRRCTPAATPPQPNRIICQIRNACVPPLNRFSAMFAVTLTLLTSRILTLHELPTFYQSSSILSVITPAHVGLPAPMPKSNKLLKFHPRSIWGAPYFVIHPSAPHHARITRCTMRLVVSHVAPAHRRRSSASRRAVLHDGGDGGNGGGDGG